MSWDLAIVGASFAGLACAEAAARRGLRVVVLERKRDAGSGVHTTGLLTREALQALRPPPHVLGARLDALQACTRRGPVVRLERPGAGFTTTDTAALLRVLAERASAAGAELRFGWRAALGDAGPASACVFVGGERLEADRVAACDGARSAIARAAGLRVPGRLLHGVERHVEIDEGHALDESACLLVLDPHWARGYAAWCVRGAHGTWQVGLLGLPRRGWSPAAALDSVLGWLGATRGVRVRSVVETRGGVVPCGAPIPLPARGRVLALGDAAGHVSALTAGGIGRAAVAGRTVGEGLGEPGEPWRARLHELAGSCGGWRVAASMALAAAGRGAGVVLGLPGVRAAAAEMAFRPTWPRPSAARAEVMPRS